MKAAANVSRDVNTRVIDTTNKCPHCRSDNTALVVILEQCPNDVYIEDYQVCKTCTAEFLPEFFDFRQVDQRLSNHV